MTDSGGQLTQRLCFNAYATNHAFRRFYQATISESGLTYPKFVILMALRDAGPLTVSDLSSRAGVEPNTLSPLLKKMAGFGLLTRERAIEDERLVVITLTQSGRELLARADAVVQQGFAELGLDPEQCMQAVRFLEDVRAKLETADPPKLRIDDHNG